MIISPIYHETIVLKRADFSDLKRGVLKLLVLGSWHFTGLNHLGMESGHEFYCIIYLVGRCLKLRKSISSVHPPVLLEGATTTCAKEQPSNTIKHVIFSYVFNSSLCFS
jgi:hypothetical protein